MKNLSGFQKLSKFFSLIKYDKKNNFLHFLQSIIRGFNPIIHVIFIERIALYLTTKNLELLQKTILFYLITILLFELLWFLSRKIGWIITLPNADTQIYKMYLKKFIKIDNNEIEKIGTGKIIAILENGRLRWAEGVVAVLEKGTGLLILLIYVTYILSKQDIIFTIGFFIILLISITVIIFVNKYQFRYRYKRTELKTIRLRLITKILMSKNEILQTNKINLDLDKITKNNTEMAKINIDMSNGRTIQNRFIPFIISMSLFIFIYIYSKNVLNQTMLLSEFIGVVSIFLIVNSSILNFTSFYIDLTKEFSDIEKMWDFFENSPEITGYETGENFIYKGGDFEVKNLSYGYNETKNIFEKFNFKIEGGKILAIVGNSGGGKTTLIKLLSGYIRPNLGEIIIDGQKLSNTSLKSYYQSIGYLTQEPSVFDGTVRENLMYGIVDYSLEDLKTDLLQEKIQKVIADAKCEFVYELPNGIDTEIGERGVKLSGGQKQRLAIAKIMLKDPKIIFLDEPTSALDSFSEEQITKAMNSLFVGKTVIIIAHRLQTVKHADKIIVIENGKVVEEGNHKTLSNSNGIYAKMLELQSGF